MEDLEKDLQNTQRTKGMGDDEVSSEEEINLIDYLRVLWKHKYLILFGSVLPALIVGLIFFFSPGNYKVTSVYDVKDEGAYDVRDESTYDVEGQGVYDVRDRSIYDVSNQYLLLSYQKASRKARLRLRRS